MLAVRVAEGRPAGHDHEQLVIPQLVVLREGALPRRQLVQARADLLAGHALALPLEPLTHRRMRSLEPALVGFDGGPYAEVYTDGSANQLFDAVVMPLDQPHSVFGVALKLKSVTICFESDGAQIIGTKLVYGTTGYPSSCTG